MKKRGSYLQKALCAILSVSMLLPYTPSYAADSDVVVVADAVAEEDADLSEELSEAAEETPAAEEAPAEANEEAEPQEPDAVSWTQPSAGWYTSYEYETKDGTLWLNASKGGHSGNIVIPAKATVGETEYSVGIDPQSPTPLSSLWEADKENLTGIKFENGVKTGKKCDSLFRGLAALTTLDLSGLDTSAATNMNGMFAGCESLETLDVSHLVTSSVTDFSSMFSGCHNLKKLDCSNFDTRKTMYAMSYMFDDCWSLTELDVSSFDTSNVVIFERMFGGCSSLKELDVSSFKTPKANNMQNMFAGLSALKSLDVRNFDFTTVNKKTVEYESDFCDNFIGQYHAGFAYPHPENGIVDLWLPANAMCNHSFIEDPGWGAKSTLKKIHYVGTEAQWAALNNPVPSDVTVEYNAPAPVPPVSDTWYEDYTFVLQEDPAEMHISASRGTITNGAVVIPATAVYDGKTYAVVIDPITNRPYGDGAYYGNKSLWEADKDKITSITFKGGVKTTENLSYLCAGLPLLAQVDLRGLDTSAATDMSYMFRQCYKLNKVETTGIDTSSVEHLSGIFYQCIELVHPGIESFVTDQVEDMNAMFQSCAKIESLDLTRFKTSHVTDMANMFHGCDGLTELKFGDGFDTSAVEDMRGMFASCRNLPELDLSRFNKSGTAHLKYASEMFEDCMKLKVLDLRGFDTSNVQLMEELFSGCRSLRELRFGEKFKTGKVRKMAAMFSNCCELRSLDVSGFNTELCEDMTSMFAGCERLNALDVSSFKTSLCKTQGSMFDRCYNLRSLDLRSFDFADCMYFGTANSGITHLYLPFYALKNYDFSNGYDEGKFKIQKIFYAGTQEQWDALKNTVPAGVEVICDYGVDENTGKLKPVEELPAVVEDLELEAGPIKIKLNATHKIKATITPENAENKKLTWVSDNPTVVSVDENGTVKGLVKGGHVMITATAEDRGTVSASCEVWVLTDGEDPGPGPVEPSEPIPGSGEATDPQPEITAETNQSITLVKGQKFLLADKDWKVSSSTPKGVVSVSKGNVTAKKAGTATLKRGSEENEQSITITVLAPVIEKPEKILKLEAGAEAQLSFSGKKAVDGTIA
ncbi:MAG: BspA family leucine-rich repeat surface protein, partial [Lachnospiraceae bacterium]|nr:BspA family leucine-rich repeat surface protein [Lachnospiraceae bacterium]